MKNINVRNKILRNLQYNNYLMCAIFYVFLKAYGMLYYKASPLLGTNIIRN